MEYTLYLLILFEILVTPSLLRDLPSYVKICKRNDPELSKCFINSMNTIRPYLIKGIPEMELPQGEPLQYYDVKAKSDVGRVRVSASAWNQTSYGFMDYDLKSVNFDFENAKCNASVFFPKIKLTGKYNFQGKVLLFAVDTIGDFEINTTNVLANVDFTGRYYTKKSQQFWNLIKLI
ncbi:hypothetical protein FQR65_LT03733 [Abscondita terminalis]|nr:hypothetical protein FQR65_LT03733 [Abscondita terminalis]